MTDLRVSTRLRTFKGGSISLSGGTVECTIRNLSTSGACLELSDTVVVPDHFKLIIKPEMLTRICEVAWRSKNRIGVRFR